MNFEEIDKNFNINDLNKEILELQIEKNVNSIFKSPKARKDRTKEEIRKAVSLGIPCESFLIEYCDFENNPELYGDVKNSEIKVECKASIYDWTELRKLETIRNIRNYNTSDIVMFWKIEGNNYVYQGYKNI